MVTDTSVRRKQETAIHARLDAKAPAGRRVRPGMVPIEQEVSAILDGMERGEAQRIELGDFIAAVRTLCAEMATARKALGGYVRPIRKSWPEPENKDRYTKQQGNGDG